MIEEGNVYILQVGTDGPIKIGYTKSDVKNRVKAIQLSSPHILRWIGVYTGTRGDERAAHSLLKNSSLRGEWFYPTQEVLAFVRQKSPQFTPLVVENILIDLRHTRGRGAGIGRRPIRIARPEHTQ